eukprot:COSAG01_NODE_6657_length_3560_cov_5.515458_3_plen_121_part_00
MDIHSRKSQSARTKTSQRFRDARQAVLFTSDVSARGMDYPDVSFVMQVGAPSSKEQYVHRTGRAFSPRPPPVTGWRPPCLLSGGAAAGVTADGQPRCTPGTWDQPYQQQQATCGRRCLSS